MKTEVGSVSIPPLEPELRLPVDAGLPGLSSLFDNEWVWRAFCDHFGEPEEAPRRIRALHLTYEPGVRALVGYAAEWRWDEWIVDGQFAVELAAGKPARLFRYPDDPHLPGLPKASSAADAHQLLAKHASISPYRVRTELVRYRHGTRAVLRHIATWRQARMGKMTFFARVMPPKRVERLLAAAEVAAHSDFLLPRIAGCWAEGGVVWLTGVPGGTVRKAIRHGSPPDPDQVLDGLSPLWLTPMGQGLGRPLDVLGGFKMTERILSQVLESERAREILQRAVAELRPFAEGWRPLATAHNDFYDDQLLVTPTGELALVDFEEAGPGDPVIDIGNMLAHLHWMARFGSDGDAYETYRSRMRAAALARFAWDPRELDTREAFALFRLAAGPVRQLQRDWEQRLEAALGLAAEVLGLSV